MAKGIKDKVAVIGMGCTKFGELWDKDSDDLIVEAVKEAIEDASLYEVPKLEKNLSVLATIAHISPLLGLLGTVTGMVRCFQTIQAKATSFHPVSPGDLAGGIWEALLTTVVGLIVAIPTFVIYNYLVSRINSFILEMEKASTELVNFLTE